MKSSFIALAFATMLVTGCSDKNPKDKSKEKAETAEKMETKLGEEPIMEKYWKLVTLEGQPVTMALNQEKEIYFMLKTDENRVQGFAGCNTFNGSYTLEKGWRIKFSPLATTMKACPDVKVNESELFKIFELTDNYSLNGDTLSLNVGRRAPLAVFNAVYF